MTGFLRRIFFDHFWWKLFSLVLATLLWFVLIDEPEMTTTIEVPVEYKNVPSGLDIATDVTRRVLLQLRGPGNRITDAAQARLAVVLDVGVQPRAGERTYTVRPENIQLPPSITMIRAVPGQVRLTLEPRVLREVPVSLRFAGPPPAGFRVTMNEVVPARIRIVGPASRVQVIEAVETDPLDLEALRGTAGKVTEVMLNTFLADPHVSPESATVIRARVLLEPVQ